MMMIPIKPIASPVLVRPDPALAYWSPPITPTPKLRALNAIEAMYAYFGSDLI